MTSTECSKGAPPDIERARILYDRWLIDVPKLLDVAALFGPTNTHLVSQLLDKVFQLQHQYAGDVQVCVFFVASILCVCLCVCVRGGGGHWCVDVGELDVC